MEYPDTIQATSKLISRRRAGRHKRQPNTAEGDEQARLPSCDRKQMKRNTTTPANVRGSFVSMPVRSYVPR